jgi:hypothetical protein
MRRDHVADVGEQRKVYIVFGWENRKGRDCLEVLPIHERIILKR